MLKKWITLALSSHRPETLGRAGEEMRRHEAIILEEPPEPAFREMLTGRLSIEDYLLGSDFEYPLFARKSCELFRSLHAEGKVLLQVEPFLEVMSGIHDFFSSGGTPAEIEPGSLREKVYLAEKNWTAALLDYYEKASRGPFDEVVRAVESFARADAARGRVRDRLRAEALVREAPAFETVYIEAGYIHFRLLSEILRRAPKGYSIRQVYLMEPVIRELTGKILYPGPGDVLTLHYLFQPDYDGDEADLLAARSLIYIKILNKEEYSESEGSFPHLRNEIESKRLCENLSYDECRALFETIRRLSTAEARRIVMDFNGNGKG